MKIQSLRITLVPMNSELGIGPEHIEVQVIAGGQVFNSTQLILQDDLESRFDYLFDRAKSEIRNQMRRFKNEAVSGGKTSHRG